MKHPQPGGLKEAVGRPGSLLADLARGGLVVLRHAPLGRPCARRAEAEPGARDRRRRHQRGAVRARAGAAGAAGSSAAASPPEARSPSHSFSGYRDSRSNKPCRPAHTTGSTPYYFVPAPSRYPGAGGHRHVLRDPRRGPVDQRPRLGRVFAAARPGHLAQRAVPVVPHGHRRRAQRAVLAARRRVLPLEHELVHLLGGDVLRAPSSARCTGRACTRCRRSATWTTSSCGPTSRPPGRPCWPASPPRRPAPSSPS